MGEAPNGGACLVFDLELHQDTADGPLVGISAGSATSAGWFSSINDGDDDGVRGTSLGADPLENAAFCSTFDTSGTFSGRVIDGWSQGGPTMAFAQYPYADGLPANGSVPPGKLLGMGACYEFFSTDTCSPGIGMLDPTGGACSALGPRALFEGQINTTGLAPGYLCAGPGAERRQHPAGRFRLPGIGTTLVRHASEPGSWGYHCFRLESSVDSCRGTNA